ncbi:MAG: hypothetical protein JNN13_15405 [Planctomycetes bacterium]|nr:hypothetical protein [Planctomycetota bacterium]MBZ0152139.1 hypothetical protein [Planctomycetota bacterium]MCC7395729.1 hypothetical protein [Planctomycetota bacterium]
MRRWFWWFLLAPQGFLLAGVWRDAGLPPIDMAVLACLFLALVADRRALPWLLLGVALGRAMVDEASLPVQILVLGVPVALLLPLRGLAFRQPWLLQAFGAVLAAIAVPKLTGLCGQWFQQPSSSAHLDGLTIVWAVLLLPPLLWLVQRLPPCRAFVEVAP